MGGKEWPVGGNFGVGASVDYVFGSGQLPSLEFKKVDFSADKFLTDLYSDKAKAKSGPQDKQPGKWKEKNSQAAQPPAKDGPKGDAKPGKAPEKPPAKPKVKPGGPKKSKKPADPKARTAEGKSVKELQDEAIKKGKKPAGKGQSKQKKQEVDEDPRKDSPASKKVKSEVKRALKGKTIANTAQADKLMGDIYSEYQPKGLKGIKLVPDPKDLSKVKVMISASIADIIEMRTKPQALKPIAGNLVTMSKVTSLYVYYDGNKPFSRAGKAEDGKPFINTSRKGKRKHAEENFIDKIPKLIELINRRRAEGKIRTPPSEPVLVTLDINRLPCDHCADKLS